MAQGSQTRFKGSYWKDRGSCGCAWLIRNRGARFFVLVPVGFGFRVAAASSLGLALGLGRRSGIGSLATSGVRSIPGPPWEGMSWRMLSFPFLRVCAAGCPVTLSESTRESIFWNKPHAVCLMNGL